LKNNDINIDIVTDLDQCQFFIFVAIVERINEIVDVNIGSSVPIMLRRKTCNNPYVSPWENLIEIKFSNKINWSDCDAMNIDSFEKLKQLLKPSKKNRSTTKKL